jgi:hypothetical protein
MSVPEGKYVLLATGCGRELKLLFHVLLKGENVVLAEYHVAKDAS